jgi:carbamate kinase
VSLPRDPRLLVVALGGQALRGPGRSAGGPAWLQTLGRSLPPLADLAADGFRLVLTHGVGHPEDERLGPEPGRGTAPAPGLDVRRAELQGRAGYAIQQALGNLCRDRTVTAPIAVVLTRVEVDPEDPAFHRPAKPIGPTYSVAQARRLERARGWSFVRSGAGARRRVVPSPRPARVLEAAAIRALSDAGVITIAAGGGGVPVVDTALGHRGVEAILQADATAALLATTLGADRLVFATGVDRAEVGHRTRSIGIERLSIGDARALLAAGEFPAASMGPKIEAAIAFVEAGGREAIITSLPGMRAALEGRTGTRIVP